MMSTDFDWTSNWAQSKLGHDLTIIRCDVICVVSLFASLFLSFSFRLLLGVLLGLFLHVIAHTVSSRGKCGRFPRRKPAAT